MANPEQIQIKDKRKHPFCIIETSFLMSENLSTCEKMVYISLCSFASARDRECFPSIDAIAQRASCSGRQVRRCLAILEELHYIEREFKDGRSTIYSILDLPENEPHTPDTQSPRTDSPGTQDTLSGEGGHTVRGIYKEYLTRTREQEKDTPTGEPEKPSASPTPSDGELTDTAEPLLPVSEAPDAMRQTAEYLLLKTGRAGLTEEEISALRTLNANHYPARVQKEIDTAAERFKRLGRPSDSLTFCYIADSLARQPSRQSARASPQQRATLDYSELNV